MKKKKSSQIVHVDSDEDDFVSPKPSKQKSFSKGRVKKKTETEPQERSNPLTENKSEEPEERKDEAGATSGEKDWSCPLCRKQVDSTSQSGHLKQCGARLGLTTEQLVGARKMEERHREDRKRLGLPDVLPAAPPRKQTAKKKVAGKTEYTGADPDLELALAMSISSCPTAVQETRQEQEAETVGSMWLPQAPAPIRKRGKQKRDVGRVLQSRTEVERRRLVGDMVVTVLEETAVMQTRPGGGGGAPLWSLAGQLDRVKVADLKVEVLRDLMAVNTDTGGQAKSGETGQVLVESVSRDNREEMARQWLELLESGEESDVTVTCSDLSLTCHSLVLRVRCPLLLPRLVTESSSDGVRRHLLCSAQTGETVRGALRWVYGGVGPPDCKVSRLLADWGLTLTNTSQESQAQADSSSPPPPAGTQCLDSLIDCMEKEEVSGDSSRDDSGNKDEHDEENVIEASFDSDWQEVCEIMTQRKRSEMSANQTPVPSNTRNTIISRSFSPDMFASSGDECEEGGELEVIVKTDSSEVAGGVKRKPESESEGQNCSKRLCSSFQHQTSEEEEEKIYDLSGQVIELSEPALSPPPPVEETETKSKDGDDIVCKLSHLSSQLLEPDLTESELVSLLVQLAVLEVTVPALIETGAGKVVRGLRGREGKVGRLAARLVVRWKIVILNHQEESSREPVKKDPDRSRDLLSQTGICQDGEEDQEDPEGEAGQEEPNCIKEKPSDGLDVVEDLPDIPDEEPQDIPDEELPPLEASYYDCEYNDFQFNSENIPPTGTVTPEPGWRTEPPAAQSYLRTPPVGSERSQEPGVGPVVLKTPVSRLERGEALTPLPDYAMMLSPQLRAELKKFGLKVRVGQYNVTN